METLTFANICRTWILQSFEIEGEDGLARSWGRDVRGLLIYSSSGHMSVSINKAVENDSSNEIENRFESILFYSGTFRVNGAMIWHQVSNASDPTRIGREMIRHADMLEDTLVLTSPQEGFGRAILKWTRAN